jgi:hypothetical protein
MSDNGLEREQTLQDEATGNHIGEIGIAEPKSPIDIPHHSSCCCMSCWQKNFYS